MAYSDIGNGTGTGSILPIQVRTQVAVEFSHNTQSWQHWHLIQMHQKYLKNEKELIFSENPYVLYTKDIIFSQTA